MPRESTGGSILAIVDESLKEALQMARRSLHDSEAARQKLETELFALRHASFATDSEEKIYSLPLTDLLQDGRVWRAPEIMEALWIDTEDVKRAYLANIPRLGI
jgi:hypothetical protein